MELPAACVEFSLGSRLLKRVRQSCRDWEVAWDGCDWWSDDAAGDDCDWCFDDDDDEAATYIRWRAQTSVFALSDAVAVAIDGKMAKEEDSSRVGEWALESGDDDDDDEAATYIRWRAETSVFALSDAVAVAIDGKMAKEEDSFRLGEWCLESGGHLSDFEDYGGDDDCCSEVSFASVFSRPALLSPVILPFPGCPSRSGKTCEAVRRRAHWVIRRVWCGRKWVQLKANGRPVRIVEAPPRLSLAAHYARRANARRRT